MVSRPYASTRSLWEQVDTVIAHRFRKRPQNWQPEGNFSGFSSCRALRTDLRGGQRTTRQAAGEDGRRGAERMPAKLGSGLGTGRGDGRRLTGVVEGPGELLDDPFCRLAQTRRPAAAVTEHLPVEEDQHQRVSQHAN